MVKTKDYETAYEIAVEPDNKAVSQTTDGFYKTRLKKKYRSGATSLHVLKETAEHVSGGCGFKKFSPFFETFNDMIGHFIAAGYSKILDELLSPAQAKINDIGPQVLTMEHLGLGFIACLIQLSIAIPVFFMELVIHGLKRKPKQALLLRPARTRQLSTYKRGSIIKKQSQLKSKLLREIKLRRRPTARLAYSLMELDEINCYTNN